MKGRRERTIAWTETPVVEQSKLASVTRSFMASVIFLSIPPSVIRAYECGEGEGERRGREVVGNALSAQAHRWRGGTGGGGEGRCDGECVAKRAGCASVAMSSVPNGKAEEGEEDRRREAHLEHGEREREREEGDGGRRGGREERRQKRGKARMRRGRECLQFSRWRHEEKLGRTDKTGTFKRNRVVGERGENGWACGLCGGLWREKGTPWRRERTQLGMPAARETWRDEKG